MVDRISRSHHYSKSTSSPDMPSSENNFFAAASQTLVCVYQIAKARTIIRPLNHLIPLRILNNAVVHHLAKEINDPASRAPVAVRLRNIHTRCEFHDPLSEPGRYDTERDLVGLTRTYVFKVCSLELRTPIDVALSVLRVVRGVLGVIDMKVNPTALIRLPRQTPLEVCRAPRMSTDGTEDMRRVDQNDYFPHLIVPGQVVFNGGRTSGATSGQSAKVLHRGDDSGQAEVRVVRIGYE